MVIIIKRKHFLTIGLALIVVVIFVFMSYFAFRTEYVFSVPGSKYTVVVDAGHGGIDGGCVGVNSGVYESDLNLVYAFNLAEQLRNFGISVVMTRSDDKGLYDKTASNLKRSDMTKRRDIIKTVAPNLVVSFHMNSFPIKSCVGAQTFFKKGNKSGKFLAECVQTGLHAIAKDAKKTAKEGDYYIVTCTDVPSVLVECGFLSNPMEELLLQQKSYQDKVCYGILCGIVQFLNENLESNNVI